MSDKELPQDLTDRIAREENEADRAAMRKYIVEPVKAAGKRLYENVMGTPEQNRIAKEREDKRNAAKGMKKGGKVSSASKRGDGCCIKGKTKGRFV
jgi:hypothetical protein